MMHPAAPDKDLCSGGLRDTNLTRAGVPGPQQCRGSR